MSYSEQEWNRLKSAQISAEVHYNMVSQEFDEAEERLEAANKAFNDYEEMYCQETEEELEELFKEILK